MSGLAVASPGVERNAKAGPYGSADVAGSSRPTVGQHGHLPEVPGLPGLRAMQRDQGEATLRWLGAR